MFRITKRHNNKWSVPFNNDWAFALPLAVLSKSQILSRQRSLFGRLFKASGIQKDKIGNSGKNKVEVDWKQVGKQAHTLAREDEKLHQAGVNNRKERWWEWGREAQVEPTRLAHWLDRDGERDVKSEALSIFVFQLEWLESLTLRKMRVVEKNRFGWRGQNESVIDKLNNYTFIFYNQQERNCVTNIKTFSCQGMTNSFHVTFL